MWVWGKNAMLWVVQKGKIVKEVAYPEIKEYICNISDFGRDTTFSLHCCIWPMNMGVVKVNNFITKCQSKKVILINAIELQTKR